MYAHRALVLVAGLSLPLSAAIAQNEKLPVTGITLYRSGVGAFERRGEVHGHADVQLRFATDQINDILKSMVILDLGGGRIDSVGYASREPLQRRLASFGIDISDEPSLSDILSRLRGSPVRISTPDGQVSGTVLGTETRLAIRAPVQEVVETPYVNVVTATGIRSVNIHDIRDFEILDTALAAELGKALAALAEHRADRVKAVDIALSGEGSRTIVVAYVHETPVWKTSYRLVLPEGPTDREGDKPGAGLPTIFGWAIVENTTDEDWNNVRLSLVSGRPVSFIMDLYEPLHAFRPQVPVPTIPGAMPRAYAGGMLQDPMQLSRGGTGQSPFRMDDNDRQERRRSAGVEAHAPAARSPGPIEAAAPGRDGFMLKGEEMGQYAAAARAQAAEVGEVFQYQLKTPVTIERQRSAMLPILTSPIEGRRVSIYNRADLAEYPMRGVELKNTTNLQLMPGPISVYDGAAYAGDAQIGHVSPGDKRLLAYAVDLEVAAQTSDKAESDIRRIRIAQGMLEQTSLSRQTTTYAFQNKDAKRPRTILVEHPKPGGWDLKAPAKAAEETQTHYRFEVAVEPAKASVLDIVHERTDVQRVALVSADINVLAQQVRHGKVSQTVVDAVRRAGELQAAIAQVEQRIRDLERERASIDSDQARIRQNMGAIDQRSDLYSRYLQTLSQQETRLEEIRKQHEQAQIDLARRRADLNDYIRNLNVE